MSVSLRAVRLASAPSRRVLSLTNSIKSQRRNIVTISRIARPSILYTQQQTTFSQSYNQQYGFRRHYGGGPAPLTRDFVQERIIDTLKGCDKVDEAKITPTANLTKDLGLDSLDVVDALFFIEEEFGIEIPDEEANELYTVDQIVDYILAQPDAF